MLRYLCVVTILAAVGAAKSKKIKDAAIEDHPYQVSIAYDGRHACSGAILSADWVVTAARCVAHRTDRPIVRVGSNHTTKGGGLHDVMQVRRHEFYEKLSKNVVANDVALLRLDPPLRLGRTRKSVKLFRSNDTLHPNARGKVTGWSFASSPTSVKGLKAVREPVISRRDCADFYANNLEVNLASGQFCAGRSESGRRSVCNGDPGAPMLLHGRLAGIVSSYHGCGDLWFPAIYTELAHFRDWIRTNMRI